MHYHLIESTISRVSLMQGERAIGFFMTATPACFITDTSSHPTFPVSFLCFQILFPLIIGSLRGGEY